MSFVLNCVIGTGVEDVGELVELSKSKDVHEHVYGLMSTRRGLSGLQDDGRCRFAHLHDGRCPQLG